MLKNLTGVLVPLALHQGKPRRGIITTTARHDQFICRIPASPRPNIFGPSIAVDGGEIDAEFAAETVLPSARQHQIKVALAIGVRYVPPDDAVIDHIAAIFGAEADQLPLDAIDLTVDSQHVQQSTFGNRAADVMRLCSAVAQCLPRRAFTLRPISLADGVADEGLLGARITARFQPFLGNARPALQVGISAPNIEAAMFAPRRWILRAPLKASEHLRPVMLFNHATAGATGEVRTLRVLGIEIRKHIIPIKICISPQCGHGT